MAVLTRLVLGVKNIRCCNCWSCGQDMATCNAKGMTDSHRSMSTTIDSERRGTTSDEVISRLREMIHRGELRSGDRLPPERDFAKMLGVSRPTLRAGIRSLSAMGVLKSRQGAGTFVVKTDEQPTLDISPLHLM